VLYQWTTSLALNSALSFSPVLGNEHGAFSIIVKCSTTELHPFKILLWDRLLLSCLQLVILLCQTP
jgi:hypothetical protein